MIGSPASRGAVAVVGAGRACLAAASSVSAASAAIAARWRHPHAASPRWIALSAGSRCRLLALNVIHGAAKVWSLSDQQRTNCALGLDGLRSV